MGANNMEGIMFLMTVVMPMLIIVLTFTGATGIAIYAALHS